LTDGGIPEFQRNENSTGFSLSKKRTGIIGEFYIVFSKLPERGDDSI
jgi:hypothetical protein